MKDCPDSYQNQEKGINFVKTTLFTGNQDTEMQVFFNECLYSAVLDSGCSATVAGEDWLKNYLDSLNQEELAEVEKEESDTIFKLGGGRCLISKGRWIIPCTIAGVKCRIATDIVDSDIPLLLSKSSMKEAKVKLDLENDCASIFGRQVDLQCTSSGHYCVPLQQSDVVIDESFSVLLCNDSDDSTFKQKQVEKLHKQFAHPTSDRLKALMKDAGIKDSKCLELVDLVSENCQVCKRFIRTPARPVVSLPISNEFNEAVAMDLKVWKPGIYFLHLITWQQDLALHLSSETRIQKQSYNK